MDERYGFLAKLLDCPTKKIDGFDFFFVSLLAIVLLKMIIQKFISFKVLPMFWDFMECYNNNDGSNGNDDDDDDDDNDSNSAYGFVLSSFYR